MNACDVCGDSLDADPGIYDADEFWTLLSRGFEPEARVIGVLVALSGMTAAQARAHWFEYVGTRPVAEWRLCPACARQAELARRGRLGRLAQRRRTCPACGQDNPAWRQTCAACSGALPGPELAGVGALPRPASAALWG